MAGRQVRSSDSSSSKPSKRIKRPPPPQHHRHTTPPKTQSATQLITKIFTGIVKNPNSEIFEAFGISYFQLSEMITEVRLSENFDKMHIKLDILFNLVFIKTLLKNRKRHNSSRKSSSGSSKNPNSAIFGISEFLTFEFLIWSPYGNFWSKMLKNLTKYKLSLKLCLFKISTQRFNLHHDSQKIPMP